MGMKRARKQSEQALRESEAKNRTLIAAINQAQSEFITDVPPKRVFDLEGLVRWEHPKFGLLPPAEFIGTAEQTGLIHPLLLRVFDMAQRQSQTL